MFVWPTFHKIQRLSLNTMEVDVKSRDVHSDGGPPVTVESIALVKIQGKDLASLKSASEMFLDKEESEIKEIARQTLDGHQRSMIATTAIADLFKSRHDFAKSVYNTAQAELIEMGLTLVSFTVQDISDPNGHLKAIGAAETAKVTMAMLKDRTKEENLEKKEKLTIQYETDTKRTTHEQQTELMRLEFLEMEEKRLKQIKESEARAKMAGKLKKVELDKTICAQNIEMDELKAERQAELVAKQKILKELELKDEVERRADFLYQQEIDLARANADKEKLEAKAQADKTKKLAEAKAEVISQQKLAEAEVLRKRAEAFAQFGNAAKLEMVLAILPRLTAEIAGPITDCKKITSVSQDGSVGFARITGEVFEVLEQVCDSVSHITGQSLGNNDEGNQGGSSSGNGGGGGGSGGPSSSYRKNSSESIASALGDRSRLLSSFGRTGSTRPM